MASSLTGITATFGAGAAAGNFGILIVETANQPVATPTGWTNAWGFGTGTAGAAGATLLQVFTKASITSGDISGGIAIADGGDHQNAILITLAGVDATTPVVFTFDGLGGTGSTSVSLAGVDTGANGTTTINANDLAFAIVATDRDSATVSTNASAGWSHIAGSNSFIANFSSATGAGGGIIVNQLSPSGTQTADVTFTCTITGSIWSGVVLVAKAPAAGTTYNDTLTEGAAAADSSTNAETLNPSEAESAATADSLNPAGSTFGVTEAETAAAAATPSATQTFVNTDAESVAAADSVIGGLLVTGSLNETAAAVDNAATAVTWGATDSEAAAANDSLASIATFTNALSEGATAADSLTAGLVIASADSESTAAAATVTATQTFANGLGETSGAADSLSAGAVLAGSLNETVAAAASATTAVAFGPALSESAAAGDAEASSAVMPNALGETAAAADALAAADQISATLGETASASDAETSSATMPNVLGESAGAADTEAAGLQISAALGESVGAAESETSAQTFQEALSESAVAADAIGVDGTTTFNEAISESLAPATGLGVGLNLSGAIAEGAAAADAATAAQILQAAIAEQAAAGDDTEATADFGATIDESAAANDDYQASVIAVITHQMAVLQAVKALVQSALPDLALGFTADSSKKARAGQREIGQSRAAVEIEYEFGSSAHVFRQPIGIVLTAPGGFGGMALDDMEAAIGAAILADRTLGGLVDWIEASAARLASRSARGVASLNWAEIVITAEYRMEGALAA